MRVLFAFGLVLASVTAQAVSPQPSGNGAENAAANIAGLFGGNGGNSGNGAGSGSGTGILGGGSGSGSGAGLTGILGGGNSGNGAGSGSGTGLLGGSGSGSGGLTGLLGGGSGLGSTGSAGLLGGSGSGLLSGGSGTGGLLGNLPIVGSLLGGDLLNNLPIVGNLLQTIGGVLGQLLNNILINVGIILNAVLEIAEDALGAVNVIVNGLLTNLLDDETIQSILDILPAPVRDLVVNLVEAVKCIVNDLQAAVPAVQKAVIQIIGLLVSPTFNLLDVNSQLSALLNILGQLTQEEVDMVNTILQRLADALNNKGCSTGPVTMPSPPGLPGFSLPTLGGGIGGTPTVGGGLGGVTPSGASASPRWFPNTM